MSIIAQTKPLSWEPRELMGNNQTTKHIESQNTIISVAEGYQPYVPQEWISSLGEVQWRQYEKLKTFSMMYKSLMKHTHQMLENLCDITFSKISLYQ